MDHLDAIRWPLDYVLEMDGEIKSRPISFGVGPDINPANITIGSLSLRMVVEHRWHPLLLASTRSILMLL